MPTTQELTEEQIRVIKLISKTDFHFNIMIQNSSPKKIDRWVKQYYQSKPVIDDLNTQGMKITNLDDLIQPNFSEELYRKAIPLLVNWLKKKQLPNHVKALIIHVLIEKPISKKFAFDVIIDFFKHIDTNYRDEWGFQSDLPIMLGNALKRWVDDAHAEIIFNLLKDKKLREDDFLLGSVSNFKKPLNIKKATLVLVEELKRNNLHNPRLGTILSTLRKLKAVEARELVYPFINYPNNYTKGKESDEKLDGFVSDAQIKNEAKKTIAEFDKVKIK